LLIESKNARKIRLLVSFPSKRLYHKQYQKVRAVREITPQKIMKSINSMLAMNKGRGTYDKNLFVVGRLERQLAMRMLVFKN
jgi:hypothetical protein